MQKLNDEALAARARELAQGTRWAEAAAAFERLARRLDDRGATALSRQAYAQAGDAFRRDDRPAAAGRALLAALQRADPSGPSPRAATCELSAVLLDAGQLDVAAELADQALALGGSAAQQALACDAQIGARLALGDVPAARRAVRHLARLAPSGAVIAVDFRNAALHRLSGELRRAVRTLRRVIAATREQPALAGPCAAAHHELGELRLWLDQPTQAREAFQTAGRLWTAAGRRLGLYLAEGGVVRADLAAGGLPLAASLDGPIAFARDRGLPLLQAQLLIARGMARGDDSLDRAIDIAVDTGATLIEGRARALRGERVGFQGDRERAVWCLRYDQPWSQRISRHSAG